MESVAELTVQSRELLSSTLGNTISLGKGSVFLARNAPLDEPSFVLKGWIGYGLDLGGTRRQILDFHIPGDLVGYCSRPEAQAKADYLCLTDVVVANAAPLVRRVHGNPNIYPGLTRALAAVEDEREQRLMNQIVRLGCMSAYERAVDLFLELLWRHQRVSGSADALFPMPLTQKVLVAALGISQVHLNRVFQKLRKDGHLRATGREIEIANIALLSRSPIKE